MIAVVRLAIRRLRIARTSAAVFALLVLITSFLAAAGPRALDRLGDDTLRADLFSHPAGLRSIQMVRQDRLEAGESDVLAGVRTAGQSLFDSIPPDVQALVAAQGLIVDTPRLLLSQSVNANASIRFRIEPGAEEHLHLVDGRLPAVASKPNTEPAPQRTVEIALAASSAAAVHLKVGDSFRLDIDPSDPLAPPGGAGTTTALIVGLFDVNDVSDPFWLSDSTLAAPTPRAVGDRLILDTVGLVSPDAYRDLLAVTSGVGVGQEGVSEPSPLRLTFPMYVDPDRIHESNLASVVGGLRKLESTYPSASIQLRGVATEAVAMRTGLRAYLEAHAATWSAALRTISVAALGPAAVALAALALAAIFSARGRRAALALAVSRGASTAQLAAGVTGEGILLASYPAIVGSVAALVVFPGEPRTALLIGLAVMTLAIILLLAASIPGARTARPGAPRDASPTAVTPRRLVLESFVVVVAVAAAAVLRQRGIAAASTAGTLQTADPLAAAAPALAGLAAGLIAVRALPRLVRPLLGAARRGRGLVGLLSLGHVAGGAGAAVLLVLLASTTLAAFSVTTLVHLDRAAGVAAEARIGADYQIASPDGALRATFDVSAFPGAEAVATVYRGRVTTPGSSFRDLAAIDVAAYDRVIPDDPVGQRLVTELSGPPAEPVSIVVSEGLASRPDGIRLGDDTTLQIDQYTVRAKVTGVVSGFAALPDSPVFVLANRDQLIGLFPGARFAPSVAFVRAPDAAGPAIRDVVATKSPGAVVRSRADVTAAVRDAPATNAIRLSLAAAAIVAALYAVLAVGAAIALAGSSRAVEMAHLRSFGMADREATAALLAEQLPAAILGFGAGLALGAGLFVALAPSLGLDALAGSPLDSGPPIDAALLLTSAAGAAVVVAVGLAIGLVLSRHLSAATAMRRGFD